MSENTIKPINETSGFESGILNGIIAAVGTSIGTYLILNISFFVFQLATISNINVFPIALWIIFSATMGYYSEFSEKEFQDFNFVFFPTYIILIGTGNYLYNTLTSLPYSSLPTLELIAIIFVGIVIGVFIESAISILTIFETKKVET